MKFFSIKIYFSLTYIYIALSHNIRRATYEKFGKFVLRRNNTVPSKEPFMEFGSDSIEICMDRCVAKPPCASVNFNSDLNICQLVDYDINIGRNYTEKNGWLHFDTGRTRLTNILDYTKQYCLTIGGVPDPCNPTGKDEYRIHYKDKNDKDCNSIKSLFDFDRSTGIILHYCSGLALMKGTERGVSARKVSYFGYPGTFQRWRITERKKDFSIVLHAALLLYLQIS